MGLTQKLPGGPHEWRAFTIFHIAGLLADQHELGAGAALAKHRLRRALPQVAALAVFRLLANGFQSLGRVVPIPASQSSQYRCKPGARAQPEQARTAPRR